MNWMTIVEQLYELIIFPVITLAGLYVIFFISTKINEIKQNRKNETASKYLDMLDNTITDAVLATTQTYVESLKKQNRFDEEAQKEAFKLTYEAVMRVLTDDAVEYITTVVGDLQTYVTNKIETKVKVTKTI